MADTVTVRLPLVIRKRGGRKVVVSPDGSVLPAAPRHVATNADPALLKALGAGHDRSYVARVGAAGGHREDQR